MSWVRAIAGVFLLLWSSTVWAVTLTWDANREPDLAGYRIYQCNLLPCTKSSGTLLVTLGAVTSFNIGTPTLPQIYFITAYDYTNNESGSSNLVAVTSAGSPPPPPPPLATVDLTVVGFPTMGMWGVEGSTTDLRDVMAIIYLDGVAHHVEHRAPYGFPADNGMTATTGRFGDGSHEVEFVFFLEDTATEIGRANVTVQEGSPSPAPVILRVVGNPAAGMWGVEGNTMDLRDVMATIYLDGVVHHVEHRWPYGFPDDNGMTATVGRFGSGLHRVEFVFSLEGTTTEIGRANLTVREGSL